jgi:hypothetical protein
MLETLTSALDCIKNASVRKDVTVGVAQKWCGKADNILGQFVQLVEALNNVTDPMQHNILVMKIKSLVREARKFVQKAYKLAPFDDQIKENYTIVNDLYRKLC